MPDRAAVCIDLRRSAAYIDTNRFTIARKIRGKNDDNNSEAPCCVCNPGATMQRYWKMFIHLVWGTKDRSHIISGKAELLLHRQLRAEARELDLVPVCVNSAWNHTHLLLSWNPALSPDDVVDELKRSSKAAWNNHRDDADAELPELNWQDGYAGFTVSPGRVDSVQNYVAHQKKHHRNDQTLDHFETWLSVK